MARIGTKEELRRIIAEPRPATRVKILDALDEQSIEFLKRCPFALVGTTSADGTVEVSPKGDEPGFIRVEDPQTLLIPERVGNNLAFGLTNIIDTGQIGIIALVPATGETLRISGTAEIHDDPRPRGVTQLARQAGAAGDSRPYQALLLPLRAFDRARQAVGPEGVAGARSHLVRQDHRAAHRRERSRRGADRRQCRGRLHDSAVAEYLIG
jgi:predicted pyridoxine 5'-phosphate oxidase superfamily flavin-nucleotide-binding protein